MPRDLLPSIVALLLCVGCSPERFAGQGVVQFGDGTPVKSAMVEFVPVDGSHVARGKTDNQGQFELTTLGQPGIQAGQYSVGVVQVIVLDGLQDHIGHSDARSVPKKFQNPQTSDIQFSIPADLPLTIVIDDQDAP